MVSILDVVVRFSTVVDTHSCDGSLCLIWWVIKLDVVVFFAFCGGYVLLWLVIMLDVLGYHA